MSDDAPARRDTLIGVAGILSACIIWGLSAIYYKLLAHIPPPEVLAHRTLWSAVFFSAIMALRGDLSRATGLVTGPAAPRVLAAALCVTANWGIFIFAVSAGRVTESSLGYYIMPLVSVVLGAVLFGERPSRLKLVAVGFAAAGVLVLIVGLNVVPIVSLALAVTFALYGAFKKALAAGAVASVTAEVVMMTPLAVGWLVFAVDGLGGFRGIDAVLLLATGPLTATPLIFFTLAARRLDLATVGVLSYINPSLQFLCAVAIFGEAVTVWHIAAFALIWTALALYSGDGIMRARRRG